MKLGKNQALPPPRALCTALDCSRLLRHLVSAGRSDGVTVTVACEAARCSLAAAVELLALLEREGWLERVGPQLWRLREVAT